MLRKLSAVFLPVIALSVLSVPGHADNYDGVLFTRLDANGHQTELYTTDAGQTFAVPFDATGPGAQSYFPPVLGGYYTSAGIHTGITYDLYSILEPGLVLITDPRCGGCLAQVIDFDGDSMFATVFSSDVNSLAFTPNLGGLLPQLVDAIHGAVILPETLLPDGALGAMYNAWPPQPYAGPTPGGPDFGFSTYPYTGGGDFAGDMTYEFVVTETPEPFSVLLLGTVIIVFIGAVRKARKVPRARSISSTE